MRAGFDVSVRVTSGAARNSVGGTWIGPDGVARLVVRVTAKAIDGQANAAVEAAVAAAFGLPKSAAGITAGSKSRLKIVRLTGAPEAAARFQTLAGEGA